MNLSERIAFLKETAFLPGVSDALLAQVAEGMDEVVGQPGATLFPAGSAGDAAYLVVEGALRLEHEGVWVATRRRGECVGEFSLIDDAPRSTAAIAETEVLLLRWNREDFQTALAGNPEVAGGLLKVLLDKLRETVGTQVQAGLERERWQQDLKRAHEIQMGMLPRDVWRTDSVEISGYCHPAADVGGDYYDYLPLDEGKLGIILGDVTGHGFYSGLFVAMAKSCLMTQATIDFAPARVMEAMNRTVSMSIQSGMLMTCCYVLLDPKQNCLTYCNAGHNFPYHYNRQEDRLTVLESTDLLLGVPGFKSTRFTQQTRPWHQGDVLVLYSDGIPEARNRQGDMFDEDRLEDILMAHRDQSAEAVKQAVLAALADYCQGVDQDDDVTLVVARAG